MTIEELSLLKESEDKVEFKAAKGGNYSYGGGTKAVAKDRRHCILGYIVALSNEGGGYLVFGMKDQYPHEVVGTNQSSGELGQLRENIYSDLKIRVDIDELFDDQQRRVVVITVPGRPIGKVFKFEDVPLMRIGGDLLPMSDEHYLRIIQEQEPDFSATFAPGLSLKDLDDNAVQLMKAAYAEKQKNSRFLGLSKAQVLTDLDLIVDGKITYAALILLGKREVLHQLMPQVAISLEYRSGESLIRYDKRDFLLDPYYILIEKLWTSIDARNGAVPVQKGPYIFDIPHFNKEVIREAVNNAVAHRDYRRQSEVVIKQYPMSLTISSPGGLPGGVTLENMISVNSTPRNRRLAEVLSKTGIVERSGQGVDKIYYQCISEAKGAPDYSATDPFQVVLKLPGLVQDKAFALFITEVQSQRTPENTLSVYDVMTLDKIREGAPKMDLDPDCIRRLLHEGLIEKVGRTNNQRYRLAKQYYSFTNQEAHYSASSPLEESKAVMLIIQHLEEFKTAKLGDFAELFSSFLTRDQTKYLVYKLLSIDFLKRQGPSNGPYYTLNENILNDHIQRNEAIKQVLIELNVSHQKDKGR
ncbi:ATP-binding protein [Hymenobacter sp. GOD-10R]|uniref:ATP-binding protein n=1 Tax=Hymenobacter sp. GOD-10R TaxID=3093922 RepID=UPI002D79D3EB|nr:ATP-binding protein [Hymenobacter sp. GOD-10R]WRQ29125.1 ATP-binding protein [Hymenobacter sp. GOD-10R]